MNFIHKLGVRVRHTPDSHRLTIYRDNNISRFYLTPDHFLSILILTDKFQLFCGTYPLGQIFNNLTTPALMPGLNALRRLTDKSANRYRLTTPSLLPGLKVLRCFMDKTENQSVSSSLNTSSTGFLKNLAIFNDKTVEGTYF